MKINNLFNVLIVLQFGCKIDQRRPENPFDVAKLYCDCIEGQLINAKDSSVNLNDCEKTELIKSRLMNIYMDYENREKYSHATIDSARKFAIQVRDIEDSLCYDKIDFKKVKKIPHIKM